VCQAINILDEDMRGEHVEGIGRFDADRRHGQFFVPSSGKWISVRYQLLTAKRRVEFSSSSMIKKANMGLARN